MSTHIRINTKKPGAEINRMLYGHFAEHLGHCIYEGIWVGENSSIPNKEGYRNDVIEALKQLRIPLLRWPGGCFADEYHWEDGIGPRDKRPSMVNTNWGGVVENNHFGTHEFFRLCEILNCEPYVAGNLGSGTVREMSSWVEYINAGEGTPQSRRRAENGRTEPWNLRCFGVGNENWGCGGNMRPEYYADLYRQYQSYVKTYGDRRPQKIACGPAGDDWNWTEVLMRDAAKYMDALALHHYTWYSHTADWNNKVGGLGFPEAEWDAILAKALDMDRIIRGHRAIMDRYDPSERVALAIDEWGTWYKQEEGSKPGFLRQENSIRDALVAALHFHIFHANASRVRMANIAQMVNVLQALILTKGPAMVKTPTYHVFDMFIPHMGARVLDILVETTEHKTPVGTIPKISASASIDALDAVHISLVNLCANEAQDLVISLSLDTGSTPKISGKVLAGKSLDHHNTFEDPESLVPNQLEKLSYKNGSIYVTLPPRSVAMLELVV